LDTTLTDLKRTTPRPKLGIATIAVIGHQLVERCETLHTARLLHRDIKPDNIMLKGDIVYLIDFGFSKSYVAPAEAAGGADKHIPYRENVALIGTKNFASTNILNGIEYSRRDDLESVFYTLVYLALDDAAWNRFTRDPYNRPVAAQPLPFIKFYQYIRSLAFSDTPDYNQLKTILCP
jgi:serine/threonine protein kinase